MPSGFVYVKPTIDRKSAVGFLGRWSYQPSLSYSDDHKNDRWIYYRFHCGGGDIGNPDRNHGDYWQTPRAAASEGWGSEHTEWETDVINTSVFWPIARTQLTEVLCAVSVSGGQYTYNFWRFYEPIPPSITLERSSTAIKAVIDPRVSDMGGETGHYFRTETNVWIQKFEQGQNVPVVGRFQLPNAYNRTISKSIEAFTLANFTGQGSLATDSKGNQKEFNIGLAATVSNIAPSRPTKIRFIATNDGPSGESAVVYKEHVFARPNTCTCNPRINGGQIDVAVHYNYDEWHPTDALILERQIGSRPVRDNTGSWTSISTYTGNLNDISNAVTMIDAGVGSYEPAVDQMTYYRVRTWHDEENNQNYGYSPYPTLVAPPKPPTVEGEFNSESSVITATINVESSMAVRTEVKVISGSHDVTGWSIVSGIGSQREVEIAITSEMVEGVDPRTKVYQLVVRNITDKSIYNVERYSEEVASDDIKSSDIAQQLGYTLCTPHIDYVYQNEDGESLTLGWSWDEVDSVGMAEEQGTEIVWTSRPWNSTTSPSTHKVQDGALLSGEVIIDGLEEGVEYNIEVKRYVVVDGKTGYSLPDRAPDPSRGLYSTPQSTPEKPYLTAQHNVAIGSSITYRWTFVDTNDTLQTDALLYIDDEIITINGSQGSYTFQTTEEGEITAKVHVRTGGGWSEASNEVVTKVSERPTCIIEEAGDMEDGTLTKMPLSVSLSGTGDVYSITVVCESGSVLVRPDGYHRIAPGQVIASAELPVGIGSIDCQLVEGARYVIKAVSKDTTTGLVSDEEQLEFVVDWASKATTPTGTVEIVDGEAKITCVGESSEVCNIWRNTSDGPVLAIEGASWSTEDNPRTYTDSIPPYAWDGCSYIIESVTDDGDSAWAEIPYKYKVSGIKIDWADGSLSAPWNLDISSRYEREFERVVHLDGTTQGNWGPRVLASAQISVQSIADDDDLAVSLKELARSNGICAVRASHGFLMFGDVSVDIRRSYNDNYLNVTIGVTGVDDDGTFTIKNGGVSPW